MARILPLIPLLFLSACSLFDRQNPPQILEVTTDYEASDGTKVPLGVNPSVGRGREVNITLLTEDDDNDELDFRWTTSGGAFQFSPDNTDTLIDLFQDSVTVVWVAPGETGIYELLVEVSDGISGEVITEMMQIAVTQGPPVAVLETTRMVAFQDMLQVTLDATDSHDPDNDELRYFWRQLLGPGVTLVEERSKKDPTPFFDPPGPADYVFELRVSDDLAPGMSDTSDAVILVIRVSDRDGLGG